MALSDLLKLAGTLETRETRETNGTGLRGKSGKQHEKQCVTQPETPETPETRDCGHADGRDPLGGFGGQNEGVVCQTNNVAGTISPVPIGADGPTSLELTESTGLRGLTGLRGANQLVTLDIPTLRGETRAENPRVSRVSPPDERCPVCDGGTFWTADRVSWLCWACRPVPEDAVAIEAVSLGRMRNE